jgi:hypothetical protein
MRTPYIHEIFLFFGFYKYHLVQYIFVGMDKIWNFAIDQHTTLPWQLSVFVPDFMANVYSFKFE